MSNQRHYAVKAAGLTFPIKGTSTMDVITRLIEFAKKQDTGRDFTCKIERATRMGPTCVRFETGETITVERLTPRKS